MQHEKSDFPKHQQQKYIVLLSSKYLFHEHFNQSFSKESSKY